METNFINNIIYNIKTELLTIYYMDKRNFLKELEDYILGTKNLELIYTMYKEIPEVDGDAYAKAIVDSNDPKYNYLLAKDFSNYNFGETMYGCELYNKYFGLCEKKVLDSRDLEYNYLFAKDIKEADKSLHAKIILDSKDAKYNYLFAKDVASDITPHEKIVLDSKNPEYSYLFATTIDSADIEAHRKVVIDSQNPEYNYLFFKYDGYYDNEDVVVESRNPKYNYYLWKEYGHNSYLFVVRDSKNLEYNTEIALHTYSSWGTPSKKIVLNSGNLEYISKLFNHRTFGYDSLATFRKIGIKSKDPKYNYELVKYISENSLYINRYKKFQREHCQIILDTKDPKYNYEVAKVIGKYGDKDKKLEEVDKHSKIVLDSGNLEYNYLFFKSYAEILGEDYEYHALDVSRRTRKHLKLIEESRNPKYNYLIVLNTKVADIKEYEQIVLDSKNPEYCYLFAKNIEGANIPLHAKVVLESKNIKYNYLFATTIENSNYSSHMQAIQEATNTLYPPEEDREYIEGALLEMPITETVKKLAKKYNN